MCTRGNSTSTKLKASTQCDRTPTRTNPTQPNPTQPNPTQRRNADAFTSRYARGYHSSVFVFFCERRGGYILAKPFRFGDATRLQTIRPCRPPSSPSIGFPLLFAPCCSPRVPPPPNTCTSRSCFTFFFCRPSSLKRGTRFGRRCDNCGTPGGLPCLALPWRCLCFALALPCLALPSLGLSCFAVLPLTLLGGLALPCLGVAFVLP